MEIDHRQPSHTQSHSSFDTEKNVNWEEQHATVPTERPLRAWASAIWAPAVHCILSVAIVVAVLVFVDRQIFNVTERSPLVRVVGGTRTAPFRPMQSDVVTILSAAIAASKWALGAWAAALCWHIVLFLMERRGIEYRSFQTLLDYSLLSPSTYSKDISTWVIGALLLSCLAANFSSPILTGSVTWISSNQLAHGLSIDPVPIDFIGDDTIATVKALYSDEGTREGSALPGVGAADLAWEASTSHGIFKRTLRDVDRLEVNTTMETVILPYFEVHSIHWISDSEADEMPGFKSLNKTAIAAPLFDSAPIHSPPRPFGCALLIPNTTTNGSSDPLEPTIIRDTRLLLLYYQFNARDNINDPRASDSMARHLSPNIYKLSDNGMYFAFAGVTFTAGVGRCKDYQCIVSSTSTVQNNAPIEPEPHYLTSPALSMAPIISLYLVAQNTSLPSSWNDLNEWIEAILVRSYSGAWNGLMLSIVPNYTTTNYVPAFPGLKAQVDWQRVNIWLGIQLLVTVLSALFLAVRAKLSEYPLRGGTSLIGFYLDTTEVPPRDSPTLCKTGVLKIEPHGDRLKVKLG